MLIWLKKAGFYGGNLGNNTVPGPVSYHASINSACMTAGAYFVGKVNALGPPYRPINGWSLSGVSQTNEENLVRCVFEYTDDVGQPASFGINALNTSRGGLGNDGNNTCNPVNIASGNKFYRQQDVFGFIEVTINPATIFFV